MPAIGGNLLLNTFYSISKSLWLEIFVFTETLGIAREVVVAAYPGHEKGISRRVSLD